MVLAMVVGCGGSGGSSLTDANHDSDGPLDDSGRGQVHVTVIDRMVSGHSLADLPVVFDDPDGTIATSTRTDGNGEATGVVAPGGSVTVAWNTDAQASIWQVSTLFEVDPGDDLLIGFERQVDDVDSSTVVEVPPFAGAEFYTVFWPCGAFPAGAGTNTISRMHTCDLSPSFDVYAVAFVSGPRAVAVSRLQNVAPDALSITIPDNWMPTRDLAVSYSNTAAISVIDTKYSVGPFAELSGADGTGFPFQLSFRGANSLETPGILSAVIHRSEDENTQTILEQLSGDAASADIDVAGSLLPWGMFVRFDVATGTFTPAFEHGMTPDIDLARYDVYTSSVVTRANVHWTLVGPAAEPMTIPPLPPDIGPFQLHDSDAAFPITARFIEATTLSGWNTIRPTAFPTLTRIAKGDALGGVVRAENWTTNDRTP